VNGVNSCLGGPDGSKIVTAESLASMPPVNFMCDERYLGRRSWVLLFCAPIMVGTSMLSGCQEHVDPKVAGAAVVSQDYRVAVKDKVPLYAAGPGQFTPPDQLLRKDDVVWVLKKEIGFSLIQTSEGQVGWVPTEDLSVAPAETVLAAGPAYEEPSFLPTSQAARGGSHQEESDYAIKKDSAIVERYTMPDSSRLSDSGAAASPSP
jgi:hypothetical protein